MNPLLQMDGLPPFTEIKPEHVEPAIDEILAHNRARLAELLENGPDYDWERLVAPVENMEDHLGRVWSPIAHLNAVSNTLELRIAYNACLPKLSDYGTEMAQNETLFAAYDQVSKDPDLNPAQRKLVNDALRDFRLAGVALSDKDKQRFKKIMQRLSELSARFEENVLDAADAWNRHITDETRLHGLPEHALARAEQRAHESNLDGWLFALDMPTYMTVIMHADDRALRREFYEAWATRASDQGPTAGRFDNTEVIEEILALRHDAARLVGFDNHSEYSLATKMAGTPVEVFEFLDDLLKRAKPAAQREYAELMEFGEIYFSLKDVQAWDLAYLSEKLREKRFEISDEVLRPYFPVPRVFDGLFKVAKSLFDIDIEEGLTENLWHDDVRFFNVFGADGKLLGSFFADLYARAHKRSGAWMDDCIGRKKLDGELQRPVAYLICNFSPPPGDKPSCLSHDEVTTLFHEFGHTLHHLLTQVDYPSISGINGVPWDAVELPSQFMENFCWRPEVLPMISGHIDTGKPLPEKLFERLVGTRTFQAGMQIVRQLELASFDFELHANYDPKKGGRVMEALRSVRDRVAVVPTPEFNRLPHSFSHIFGGGYAAGYYSYKWAEVLSADAFSAFEKGNKLDWEAGRRFRECILESGGSRDAMESFVAFRGRKPTTDALLRHNGIDTTLNAA